MFIVTNNSHACLPTRMPLLAESAKGTRRGLKHTHTKGKGWRQRDDIINHNLKSERRWIFGLVFANAPEYQVAERSRENLSRDGGPGISQCATQKH